MNDKPRSHSGLRKALLLALPVCAAVVFLAGLQTEQAIRFALGTPRLRGIFCLVFLLGAVLFLIHEAVDPPWKRPWIKRCVGYFCCWYLYDLPAAAVWYPVCRLFSLPEAVSAAGTGVIAAVALLVVPVGHWYAGRIRTREYTLSLGGRTEYRAALFSDLHLGAYVGAKQTEKAVRAVNALRPEMVLIAGDLLDDDNRFLDDAGATEQVCRLLRSLKAPGGVFFVPGNHDPSVEDPRFLSFLGKSGITLLHNARYDTDRFTLVGRSDAARNARTPLAGILEDAIPAKPLLVLDHDPCGIPEAVRQDAALVLCGHTHAGQLFPATLLTKWFCGRRFFYGHQRFGSTQAVITSGAGFFNLPIRVGSSSEVVSLRLLL